MTDEAKAKAEFKTAAIKTTMLRQGFSEQVVEAWDPDLKIDLPEAATDAKTLRIAKAIGDGQFEGDDWYENARFTPKEMIAFLSEAGGEDVMIEINSPGGSVFGGSEVASAINEYEGKTTALVTGVAASMASVIAAACDEVILAPSAMIMIHSASSICLGNARDMRDMADFLEKATVSMGKYYEKRMDADAVANLLSGDDNWMTADEAMEAKFADEIKEMKKAGGGNKPDAEARKIDEEAIRRNAATAELARMAHFGI